MTWQENLFQNLLVVGILLFIGLIIYCKVKNKTFIDVYYEINEILNPKQQYE